MLCIEIVPDIQSNFCTQHVLQKEELLTKIYLYNSDPKELSILQKFQHFSTDFFGFVEAFVIQLIKNAFGQVRKSFTQILHCLNRKFH